MPVTELACCAWNLELDPPARLKLGLVAHTVNPSITKVEARTSGVKGQPGQYSQLDSMRPYQNSKGLTGRQLSIIEHL